MYEMSENHENFLLLWVPQKVEETRKVRLGQSLLWRSEQTRQEKSLPLRMCDEENSAADYSVV